MQQSQESARHRFQPCCPEMVISMRRWRFTARLFDFELRGRSKTSAFIDLGDQFFALQKGRDPGRRRRPSFRTRGR